MPLARAPLLAQTECVLQGIAGLAAALKRANVLDRSVIIVNGDHGTVLAPPSVRVPLANPQVRVADLGQARPALLIKALDDTGPFRVTTEPTSHLDIRPTILGIAGLKDDGPGIDLMTEAVPDDRVRLYHVLYDFRWGATDPVSHVRFAVGRDALNTDDWSVDAFVAPRVVPRTFGAFGTRDLTLLQSGAIALSAMDERGAWVAGRRLSVLLAARDERDNALTVTLRLPEAHAGAGVTIRVNGVIVDRHAVVASADARGWARAQTCVPKSTSRGAHEFVELHFAKTSIVAGVAVPVSALVRDIAFDRAPSCGGRHRM
jgi:hypothetical protein